MTTTDLFEKMDISLSEAMPPHARLASELTRMASFEEVAEMCNVQKSTVWKWKSLGILPDPLGELSGRSIWSREEIVEWAHSTGRTIIL